MQRAIKGFERGPSSGALLRTPGRLTTVWLPSIELAYAIMATPAIGATAAGTVWKEWKQQQQTE